MRDRAFPQIAAMSGRRPLPSMIWRGCIRGQTPIGCVADSHAARLSGNCARLVFAPPPC